MRPNAIERCELFGSRWLDDAEGRNSLAADFLASTYVGALCEHGDEVCRAAIVGGRRPVDWRKSALHHACPSDPLNRLTAGLAREYQLSIPYSAGRNFVGGFEDEDKEHNFGGYRRDSGDTYPPVGAGRGRRDVGREVAVVFFAHALVEAVEFAAEMVFELARS